MSAHTGFWKAAGRIALWGGVLLILLLPNITQAQEQENAVPLNYEFYTSFQGATVGQTPFWHHANTYGRLQHDSEGNWLSGATLEMPYQQLGPIQVASGAELTSRVSDTRNSMHFTQLYAALRYKRLRLRIGRFKHFTGLHNEMLSMGSMLISRNATPIPKVELATPEYIDIPLSDGNLQIRLHWSEGRLGEDRYLQHARLHQKSLHFKVPIGPHFEFVGGFSQGIQWAGSRPDGERPPRSFRDYTSFVFHPNGGVSENTVGSYDISAMLSLSKWQFQAYRQIYLEDLFFLRSPWDGLWGIGVQNSTDSVGLISEITYEFLNTIQQDAFPGLPQGRARYYSHHVYRSGWTYHGKTLGNPLLLNPDYRANDHSEGNPNLMVIAHHIGLGGQPTERLQYETRLTYSRNYGICKDQLIEGTCQFGANGTLPSDLETIPRIQLRQDQYATHLDVRYLLSETYGMRIRSSVAVDWGEFDGTQIGVMLGLQWDGTVSL